MEINDWNDYKQLLLHEMGENGKRFERMFTMFETISKSVDGIRQDVSGLKIKVAIIGGIAGVIGTGIATTILSAFR